MIARAYTAILPENLTSFPGPQTAYCMFGIQRLEMRVWEGKDGVESGLLAEIRRLANVALPRPGGGWEAMPYEDVRAQKLIDDDRSRRGGKPTGFFYLDLSHVAQEGHERDAGYRLGSVGSADYIIQLYGISSFLADIEAARAYWREGASIAHTILTWAAEDGFAELMRFYDPEFSVQFGLPVAAACYYQHVESLACTARHRWPLNPSSIFRSTIRPSRTSTRCFSVQHRLTKQPAQWAQVGSAIRSNAQGFQAIVNALVAQTAVLAQVQQTQHKETTELDRQDKLWARIARNTRGVYHDVLGATEALVKWTGLTTIFTGLLGAGSLYGLERIAETIGESRRTALGYGVGIGQQRAFGLDFGRFVNDPNQLLGGVAGAMLDIASPGYAGLVGGAGFSPEFLKQNNAAQVSAALLDKIPQIFAGLSDQMIQSRLTATGLDQLGLTSFDVKRLRDMQPEEREQQKRYLEDTTAFNLDPATAKQWQDLDTQLQRASGTIFTVLVQGLTSLTDPLKKLSTSVVDVLKHS